MNKTEKIPNAYQVLCYLALTPLLDEAGFLADFDGSLIPTPPLRINLLRFKYSSTSLSTLPLSCFGFLIHTRPSLAPISTPDHPEQNPNKQQRTRGEEILVEIYKKKGAKK